MNINLGNLDQIIDYCQQNHPSTDFYNILVVGIGGGSDVLSAYTIAMALFNRFEQMGVKSQIAYANTKRGSPDLKDAIPLSPQNSICVLKNPQIVPLTSETKKGKPKPVEIEESLPRNQFGSYAPLLFYLEDMKKIQNYEQYLQSFRSFIEKQQFDLIIGVDNGGDSLAKGKAIDPDDRDRQMLELLKGVQGTKLIHMVVAPTIDGETPPSEMVKILTEKPPNFYLNSEFLLDQYSVLAQNLAANKTPNLIIEGWRLYRENPNLTLTIDRPFLNKPPETIPVFFVTLIAVYLYH